MSLINQSKFGNFDKEDFINLKSNLLKIFNKDETNVIEPEDVTCSVSYKNHEIIKKFIFPKVRNDVFNIPLLPLQPSQLLPPREIRMNWYKPEEIENEDQYNEGLFTGYIIMQITERNFNTYDLVTTQLSSEETNTQMMTEFTEFWKHYCQHLQANFQEFENAKKTIKMDGNVDINLLFDWILLYSASFRTTNLFNILYQTTDFSIKFNSIQDTVMNYFCRTVSRPVSRPTQGTLSVPVSIMTNLLQNIKGFEYLVEVFGLVNTWKFILHDKNDKDRSIQITNQISLAFVILADMTQETFNELFKKTKEDYCTVLNMLAEFTSDTGNNILHYIIQLILHEKIRLHVPYLVEIFGDLFKGYGYLLKKPNKNNYVPLSYCLEHSKYNLGKFINKLIETNYILVDDVCYFSDNVVPALCNAVIFLEMKEEYIKAMFVNDPETVTNAIIQMISQDTGDILVFKRIISKFSLMVHKLKKENFFINLFNLKIKLYNFDKEYPLVAIFWCFGINMNTPRTELNYPFLLNTIVRTKKFVHKFTSFDRETLLIKILCRKKYSDKYFDTIKDYYKNLQYNYFLEPSILNTTKLFFLNMTCHDFDDVCLKIYFLLEIISNSSVEIFNIVDFVSETNEFYPDEHIRIYKYFVDTLLYFLDRSNTKGLKSIINIINNSYFAKNKEFANVFTESLIEKYDWITWNSKGRKLYQLDNLKNITIDIINKKKLKGIELIKNDSQVTAIIYYSKFITDYDFLENFLSNNTDIITKSFESLNMVTIQQLANLNGFDWKIIYDTFVNITKDIHCKLNDDKVLFLNWMYCQLKQDDINKKFMENVKYNDYIVSNYVITHTKFECFIKYLLFLVSNKIVTLEIYGDKYYEFIKFFLFYTTTAQIASGSSYGAKEYLSDLTTTELETFFGLKQGQNIEGNNLLENFKFFLGTGMKLGCEKRFFFELLEFLHDKKVNLFLTEPIGFLKEFKTLVECNFIDVPLIKSILINVTNKDYLKNSFTKHDVDFSSMIKQQTAQTTTQNGDNDSEENYSDTDEDEEDEPNEPNEPELESQTVQAKIINDRIHVLLTSLLEIILNNFSISELLCGSSFDTNELTSLVYSDEKYLMMFLTKLNNLPSDELKQIINNCELTNGYNLIEQILKFDNFASVFASVVDMLNLVCKYGNLAFITSDLIEKIMSNEVCKSIPNLFDAYVKLSVDKNNKMVCMDKILKHHPHNVLYFPNYKDFFSMLTLNDLISILKNKKYDIDQNHQDDLLEYVSNTYGERELGLMLENIFIESKFLFDNYDTLLRIITLNLNSFQNLIKLDSFSKKILLVKNSNGDYLLSFVSVSNISVAVAELFVSMLTTTDLLKRNKRGKYQILNFLIDPYVKYLINKFDMTGLFSNDQIGPIIFEELAKIIILKQSNDDSLNFLEILKNYPENVIVSKYVDTHQNNFHMCILETFKKEYISNDLLNNDFIKEYIDSICNVYQNNQNNQINSTVNVLSHKNSDGNNLLFLSVHFDKIFRKLLRLYIDVLGTNGILESNNNNETLLMYVVRYNAPLISSILDNDTFDENNSFIHINTGSILTYSIIYQKNVNMFEDILNWNKLSGNTFETTQQIQLFNWASGKTNRVFAPVSILACVFNKDMFKSLIDSNKIDITKNILHLGQQSLDIYEVAYLYSPESFHQLIGSKFTYDNFPNDKHKNFFINNACVQPGSWYNFVSSRYFALANYTNNDIWKLHWTIRPAEIVKSHMAKYIQTKNEHTDKSEEVCEICLNYKKKIMFGCLRHITCVVCAYKAEECPICKNKDILRIKIFE